ncbi:FAD:protein FMN transferase [Chromohalobacter israelensis]|uniref:FAD:protein FMN transferase n=1 Tax=Chromohalobacter israelensis (strain ATCC BAA-138 / DSM 3043 / CIP 106854 / NCIMB 13768 / 1H11) TaxID=290398 RepID=Q1QX80_CHRI1|nr:FAD:protein FMN transferase [Chromohalobacter salexigens]ABE58928.1 ApbE-like lipoprotein [Chromohalobacter salexigens DSM 3043]NWO54646.1 FAD:protein FMN transferase [Chromohalobacter salexigens]
MKRHAHRAGPAWKGLVLFALLALVGCDRSPEAHRFEGPIFGTGYHVTVYGDFSDRQLASLKDGIDDALEDVDRLMSTYKPESELSRFNAAPVGEPFALSPPTAQVIDEAIEIGELSNGAFDVTVGAAVNLWGFGPDKRPDEIPSDAEIAEALEEVDFRALHLNGNRLTKTKPVYVDLSGIAKGYGVDHVAARLDALGVTSYLVEVGGEIRTRGTKPGGEPWRVAVEKPVSRERSVQRVLELEDVAVATSGDYRNYYEEDGRRYSHTIDPRTGRPITHHLASVTVVAEQCSTADGLATALEVLGPKKGMALANREDIAAYFIVKTDEGFTTELSDAFHAYLAEPPSEGGEQ